MRQGTLLVIFTILLISPNASSFLLKKFLADPCQKESVKHYNSLPDNLKKFLSNLYKGHLKRADLELLKFTLKSDHKFELNHWYFNDKLNDLEDRKMPYWNLRDIRKLAAYGPLFFTSEMDNEDKFQVLKELYHSDLIQKKDFAIIIRPLAVQIDLCLTHKWGNTDTAIICAILNMIDYPGINNDDKFAIIRAVRTLVPGEKYPGWVMTTFVDELPHFLKGLAGGYEKIIIALLEAFKTHEKKQNFITVLAKEVRPDSSFAQRLKFIQIRTSKKKN